jgi:hypothetical protein
MNDDHDLYIDGNAAGGVLGEIFAVEMTAALATCDACGATRTLAATRLYEQAPGMVLRCPDCLSILMCITRTRDRLLVDMRGVRIVQVTTS